MSVGRVAAILCALAADSARATTIDPLTWEQLLFGAEFVGVVECKTAGEIVAKYAVVESWKGAPSDSELTIAMATNYWGQQAPIALVGERFLVTAFKQSPTHFNSSSSGGAVPVWWRRQSADLRLPLFQGMRRLPLVASEKGILETDAKTLAAYRAKATAFLLLDREAQEAALLIALVKKYFANEYFHQAEADRATVEGLQKALAGLKQVKPLVEALLDLTTTDQAKWSFVVGRILGQGGPLTYGLLAAIPVERRTRGISEAVEELAWTWAPPPSSVPLPFELKGKTPAPLHKKELQRLRAALKASKDDPPGYAIEGLVAEDCSTIATHFSGWNSADGAYPLASYIAWRCGTDRKASLSKLASSAKSPWIRVAAAVYLSFDDEKLGVARLRDAMALPGDPGAWAAITLARRGNKDALPRAISVFASAPAETRDRYVSEQLQARLCVLLSNATGKVPPPLSEGCAWTATLRDALDVWWKANAETTVIADPWFSELAAQKVD